MKQIASLYSRSMRSHQTEAGFLICLCLAWATVRGQGAGNPVLVHSFNWKGSGGVPGLRLGDLDGDGKYAP